MHISIIQTKQSLARIALILALGAFATASAAALFEIQWWTADGGGAQAITGGAFHLRATAGQPDAGRLSGGLFVLNGGYWSTTLPKPVTSAGYWEEYR